MSKFETKAIKSTEPQFSAVRPVTTPIYLTTTFHRNLDGTYNEDFCYSRENNPNRSILENSLATLENGKYGFAFSSGMAAIAAIFQSLQSGDHVIVPDDVYYALFALLDDVYKNWGLTVTKVDMTNLELVQSSVQANTKLIWIETPSNPQLKVTDIAAIAKIAAKNNALCVVDNTWSTPVLQNPLDIGADAVIHSTSKYFGGHSDVLSGAIVIKEDESLATRIKKIQKLSGAVPSPFDAWLVARGIQTMALRIKTQSQSAAQLAEFLSSHPKIEQVNYPGLKEHPQHEIAKKQMQHGYGAMLSVLIKGDADLVHQISHRLQFFTVATSLGGVESLVEHRKSVEGVNSLTPDNLLRISVGLEHIDDLIADWEQALAD